MFKNICSPLTKIFLRRSENFPTTPLPFLLVFSLLMEVCIWLWTEKFIASLQYTDLWGLWLLHAGNKDPCGVSNLGPRSWLALVILVFTLPPKVTGWGKDNGAQSQFTADPCPPLETVQEAGEKQIWEHDGLQDSCLYNQGCFSGCILRDSLTHLPNGFSSVTINQWFFWEPQRQRFIGESLNQGPWLGHPETRTGYSVGIVIGWNVCHQPPTTPDPLLKTERA